MSSRLPNFRENSTSRLYEESFFVRNRLCRIWRYHRRVITICPAFLFGDNSDDDALPIFANRRNLYRHGHSDARNFDIADNTAKSPNLVCVIGFRFQCSRRSNSYDNRRHLPENPYALPFHFGTRSICRRNPFRCRKRIFFDRENKEWLYSKITFCFPFLCPFWP